MKHWLLILIIGLPLVLSAQSKSDTVVKPGTVQIIADPDIDSLMAAVKRNVEKDPVIKGYRVQIIAAGSRADINKIKGQFYTLFPDMKTFVIYQQPNFKLRVGN